MFQDCSNDFDKNLFQIWSCWHRFMCVCIYANNHMVSYCSMYTANKDWNLLNKISLISIQIMGIIQLRWEYNQIEEEERPPFCRYDPTHLRFQPDMCYLPLAVIILATNPVIIYLYFPSLLFHCKIVIIKPNVKWLKTGDWDLQSPT